MVCILAKGSGDCASPTSHDHPPQRLLQNFPDTTSNRTASPSRRRAYPRVGLPILNLGSLLGLLGHPRREQVQRGASNLLITNIQSATEIRTGGVLDRPDPLTFDSDEARIWYLKRSHRREHDGVRRVGPSWMCYPSVTRKELIETIRSISSFLTY